MNATVNDMEEERTRTKMTEVRGGGGGTGATAAAHEVWAVRNFTCAWVCLTFNGIYNTCEVGHWMGVRFPRHDRPLRAGSFSEYSVKSQQ